MAGTDFSHLTDDELLNGIKSLNIPDYIRTKSYGIDVRETLAQMTEMLMQLAYNQGMDPQQAQEWAMQLANKVDKGTITFEDINKNVSKLDASFFTDEFLNDLAGGTINATNVLDGTITTDKLTDKGVTPKKLSDDTIIFLDDDRDAYPNLTINSYIDMNDGTLKSGVNNNNYASTAKLTIPNGTDVIITELDYYTPSGSAGWALYDVNNVFIAGGKSQYIELNDYSTKPRYFASSNYDTKQLHAPNRVSFYSYRNLELKNKTDKSIRVPLALTAYVSRSTGTLTTTDNSMAVHEKYKTSADVLIPFGFNTIKTDANFNYISDTGWVVKDKSGNFLYGGFTKTIPILKNARYLQFSNFDENKAHGNKKLTFTNLNHQTVYVKVTTGKWINITNGSLNTLNDNYAYTDRVSIPENSTEILHNFNAGTSGWAIFDSTGAFVRGGKTNRIRDIDTTKEKTIQLTNFEFEYTTGLPKHDEYFKLQFVLGTSNKGIENRIVSIIGDSITYGADTVNNTRLLSYTEIVNDLTGALTLNYGRSGRKLWTQNTGNPLMALDMYRNVSEDSDIVMVLIGVNDIHANPWERRATGTPETMDENTTKETADSFIENYDLLARLMTAKFDASKTKLVFATYYDCSHYETYINTGWTTAWDERMDAIRYIGAKYAIPVFDLEKDLGINPQNDPTNKYFPAASYGQDLHPNQKGQIIMGRYFSNNLQNIAKH